MQQMQPRIGSSSTSLLALMQSRERQQTAFARLASGKRITKAADDAAGLSISEAMRAIEAGLRQGSNNVQDGISVAQIADGSLSTIGDSLGRMRELAMQAQNGTLSDADRAVIQEEYDQLAAEVDRVAQSTAFNGRSLLNGGSSGGNGLRIEDGTGGGATLLSIGDHRAAALGIAGRSVGDAGTLNALDDAIGRVASSRGQLGAMTNALESRDRQIGSRVENLAASRSRIADADVAHEASVLAREKIIGQGALSMLKKSQREPGALLRLLA